MASKLEGEALRWLEDYEACLLGEHGDWWMHRSVEAAVDSGGSWEDWRSIRTTEHAPGEP